MKTIKRTKQFKKDFKKYTRYPEKVEKIMAAVRLLEREEPIPKQMRPHRLIGDYEGYMELHIEGDLLLIWLDEKEDIIRLIRLGSHAELF